MYKHKSQHPYPTTPQDFLIPWSSAFEEGSATDRRNLATSSRLWRPMADILASLARESGGREVMMSSAVWRTSVQIPGEREGLSDIQKWCDTELPGCTRRDKTTYYRYNNRL